MSWPAEIRLKTADNALYIRFEDGRAATLPAEYLRVESPSAEVQGHGGGDKPLTYGKSGVRLVSIEPVGNYAVRLGFDDGHDSGLYSWAVLAELMDEQAPRMAAYLDRIAAAGKPR